MVGVPEHVGGSGRVAEELRRAAAEGDLDSVVRLLGLGAAVDGVDDGGFTPLQRASCEGQVEIVKHLIKSGANVNRQDPQHGNTPLHEASWKGYSQTAELIVKAKANVYLRNLGGFAPLHLACQNGHNQTCRVLLLAGCKPDIKNNYGDTPIHTAARYGHAGVTRILLSARANVKEMNKNGDTALHIAAAMGRRKLTRMLLEAAADQTTKNKQGENPADIASRKDFNQILEILRNPPPIVTPEERLKQEEEQKRMDSKGKKEGERTRKDKRREKTNDSGTSSKDSATKPKEKKKLKGDSKVDPKTRASRLFNWGVEWSPYGCHVAPPHESKITSPKLKTLPPDPLSTGEQYFVDLGGNIKKGPVGVGSTCYCAPLFHTVQHKMERDKIDLMDHIDAAHGKLGDRISSLETKTKGHIQKLGDTVQQKMAQEREECLQRTEHLKENQEKVVASKVAQMQTWIERRLAHHHPDSPPSVRGKTFVGRGPSFRNRDYPLVRSRSEEAVSEIIKEDEDEEPLYKGLRVLDYPTSMYNIPQRIEDTVDDPFLSSCSKSNRSVDDTQMSHIAFRNEDRHYLQSLFKVSEPEESSTNECSTHKSSTISDKQEEPLPMTRSRMRVPLPPDIAPPLNFPQDSYVPPELNQAVGNLHVCENRQYENEGFREDYKLKQYDKIDGHQPYKSGVPPDLINKGGDSRYNNFRNTNPYMYSLRDKVPYQPNHSHETSHFSQKNNHPQTFPYHPREDPQMFHVCVDQPYNDPEASTYLDMDRYRIQAAVKKLYNGYVNDGHIDRPRNGKPVLETSTEHVEHDSHNDSGYSTRLCTTSQGPSPPLSGLPVPLGGGELNGRVHDRLTNDQVTLRAQPPSYNVSRDRELFRRYAENGTSFSVPQRRISGFPVSALVENTNGNDLPGVGASQRPNGELFGESSLV